MSTQLGPEREPSPVQNGNLFPDLPNWDDLFDDDNEIVLDEAIACSLENPEVCESCQ